jgi:serine/threonine-protein kinase
VALVVALLIGGGAAAYLLTRPVKKVVPPVTGENINTARTVIQDAGFSVSVINVTNPAPSGQVIGENPVGGSKADEGSIVTLTVSSGPGSVNVPSVQGETVGQARLALTQAGLKVGPVRHQSSSSTPAGQVIDSSPTAGQSIAVGSSVTLFVSTGPAKVTIPDVTGETEAQAKSDLHAAGFQVTTTTETTSSGTPGDVITQTPIGNTLAVPGSTVNIVIAQAPPTATVPDVKNQTAPAAKSALQGAGFKVVQQAKSVTKQDKNGIVLSESPAAGTMAKKGSTVTITVGQYIAPTPTTPTNTTTTPTTPTTSTTSP